MRKRYYEWIMKQYSRLSYRFYAVYNSERINWELFRPRVRNEFLMASLWFSRKVRIIENRLLWLKCAERVAADLAAKKKGGG